jgi:penicillin amidase
MKFAGFVRGFFMIAWLAAAPSAPAQSAPERLQLSGLKDSVEILKDRWGISHIYAKNEADLFFAQGYNVARDRLFQLELWRRQATGTMAEILGRKALRRDIGNRLFMYRGDLTQELNWYHPRGAEIIESFVNGINARIAETRRNPALLTPEFKMLGIKPGNWTAAVVISRFNALLGNVTEELNIALAIRAIGVERVKDLDYFQPPDPDLDLDPAIDASLLSDDVLGLYSAFRTPLRFSAEDLAPEYRNNSANRDHALAELGKLSEYPSAIELSQRRQDMGSNNWVVSGKLTASGYPMMMNDPHRNLGVPSLRYWVHLEAPGWNVIGGGEPALPGVSIGHNEQGAWGLTIFGTDSEDLYVYDTNPENSSQYKYAGDWESMTVIRESVPVRGAQPSQVELKYTRHGPVVFEDSAHRKAYAVRAAWREIGGAPYLASLRMDQARTWQDFRDACAYSRIPAENMVWADRDGNIGYQAVGIAPLRPNWSGLLPVPGDGRYEWDGSLPIKALPHVENPEKGFFNTSNNYLIPPGWPYKEALHYTWADPYRADTVEQFLRSGRMFTVADMVELQNSVFSIAARELVPLLRDIDSPNQVTDQARMRLLDWDFNLDKNSVPAGIYEMWQRQIQADVRALFVPKEAQEFIGIPPLSKIIHWMEVPDGRFGPDPIAGRDAFLLKSLDETVASLTPRLGADMEKWKLGAYHHALIYHALSDAMKPEERTKFNVGDLSRGGDVYTVNATPALSPGMSPQIVAMMSHGGDAHNQLSGGSFKIIVDTEDWDNSLGLNTPGQSGDVNDPHYRDLYPLWASGRYFPIFYSRRKIESVVEKRFDLQPVSGSTAHSGGR